MSGRRQWTRDPEIIQVADLPGTGTLGFVLGLANTIRSTANTIFQLKAAYDSCP
jgi:hypothetical protein